jgi:predicted  nucleic acid-binding Zn-ribbon protein
MNDIRAELERLMNQRENIEKAIKALEERLNEGE